MKYLVIGLCLIFASAIVSGDFEVAGGIDVQDTYKIQGVEIDIYPNNEIETWSTLGGVPNHIRDITAGDIARWDSAYYSGGGGGGGVDFSECIKQTEPNFAMCYQHNNTNDEWSTGIGFLSFNYRFNYNGTGKSQIRWQDGSYGRISDRKYKSNIEPLDVTIKDVLALKPSRFDIDGVESIGFIAQDVERVQPDLVRHLEDGSLGLCYDDFVVLAIAAIQDQQNQIDSLRQQIHLLIKTHE